MGLDASQLRFVTRLRAGEALVYSDEFAEAAHVDVRRTVLAEVGDPEAAQRPPFDACRPCRAKCRYRGASLAMSRDPELRLRLSSARMAVAEPEPDQAVLRDRWTDLLNLRQHVRSFRALPVTEPEVSDAAYCLFVHTLVTDTVAQSPRWPASVARQLG